MLKMTTLCFSNRIYNHYDTMKKKCELRVKLFPGRQSRQGSTSLGPPLAATACGLLFTSLLADHFYFVSTALDL